MKEFDEAVVSAVTGHMNGDHPEDNLLIARAFGYPDATECTMTGLNGVAGTWNVIDANGSHDLSVDWPGGPITERPDVRREVVALYKAACAKLGVTPREEEVSGNPHGGGHHGDGNPHGGGHPHGGRPAPENEGAFAKAIRTATWGEHSDSEGSTFMEDIMKGQATLDDYTELVVQHYFIYLALEAASKKLAADPQFAGFHLEALVRIPLLEDDLEFLIGSDWRDRIQALPATVRYADRITELAEENWLPGIVAHHYTRYLGDLSGGQMIAKRVVKQHGFDHLGVAFYDFSDLGPIPEFKSGYREALNQLGERLNDDEKQRVIDEVLAAYRFNTATFVEMDQARGKKVIA